MFISAVILSVGFNFAHFNQGSYAFLGMHVLPKKWLEFVWTVSDSVETGPIGLEYGFQMK